MLQEKQTFTITTLSSRCSLKSEAGGRRQASAGPRTFSSHVCRPLVRENGGITHEPPWLYIRASYRAHSLFSVAHTQQAARSASVRLNLIGVSATPYIPHRGFGVHHVAVNGLRLIVETGQKLLVKTTYNTQTHVLHAYKTHLGFHNYIKESNLRGTCYKATKKYGMLFSPQTVRSMLLHNSISI